MSQVGIELVGGPADGRQVIIPGDPMNPPSTYELQALSDPTAPVPVRTLTYRREPNPGDDGPLWLYRYENDQP